MNVWPPEELLKTIISISLPILLAPLVAWGIFASFVNKFNNNETISLGEFGNILGFSILLLVATIAIIIFFVKVYKEEYDKTKPKLINSIGYFIFSIPCVYIAIAFVIYLLLKFFYKY